MPNHDKTPRERMAQMLLKELTGNQDDRRYRKLSREEAENLGK